MKKQPEEKPKPSWLHRESTGSSTTGRDGRTKCTVSHELVWGHSEMFNQRRVIVGESCMTLSGPTARASIVSLAEQYNLTGKQPPEKFAKCVADGGRLPKDGGVNQECLRITLQPRP